MVSNVSSGKQPLNPDELYFNDMDIKAWERRAAEQDGRVYDDDYENGYGYLEDEGYYEDAGGALSPADYEELLFQRTLDKIRVARVTGDADVSLTPEELHAYQNRMWRQRMPVARPQTRPMQPSAVAHSALALSATGAPAPSSSRSKKSQRRSSLFGSKDKSKKEKSASRARTVSNATDSTVHQAPPGFLVPGPHGQPMFAPINPYQGHIVHDDRQPASSLRPGSRSSSNGNERPAHGSKGKNMASPNGLRQVHTPPETPLRLTTSSRDIPGAFPSSPISYRMPTPPLNTRPESSSSRLSAQDHADRQVLPGGRDRSSIVQQPPKLVPFPVTEYKHHNTEPYQYQAAGHLAQPSSEPKYARKTATTEAPHVAMPRRVPVPNQHPEDKQGTKSNHRDPAIPHTSGMVDVAGDGARTTSSIDDGGSSVKTAGNNGLGGGGAGEGERRRRSGRSRRKH